MKDIKLTIEDIKKIFECFEVEDYKKEIIGDKTIIHVLNRQYPVLVSVIDLRDIEYKLFLQRVIEGINISETNVNFDISYCDNEYKVECFDLSGEVREFKIFCAVDCGSIDQAKIKAIKYILDKLK